MVRSGVLRYTREHHKKRTQKGRKTGADNHRRKSACSLCRESEFVRQRSVFIPINFPIWGSPACRLCAV
jgi:hypothetical protein